MTTKAKTKKTTKDTSLGALIKSASKGRSKQALGSDKAKVAIVVFTRKDARKWAKKPGRYDLAGVDTPRKKKAKRTVTKKRRKSRKR